MHKRVKPLKYFYKLVINIYNILYAWICISRTEYTFMN